MRKFRNVILAVLLVSPTVGIATGVGPVRAALSYPAQGALFPACATVEQEFCIETLEVTLDSGGGTQLITDPVSSGTYWINVGIFGGTYTGPSGATGMGGMFPSLSINYYDTTGFNRPEGDSSTKDGLDAGTYRTVVRIGDYDPSYLLLSGEHVEYSVDKGADGYYTVDLTARPKPYGGVVTWNLPSGVDDSMMKACLAGKWITNCESNMPFRSYLLSSFTMVSSAAQRDILRGTWLSTNASTFSLGTVNLATGEFGVNVAGPHYLPTDFGAVSGALIENGRQVAPAFFKMFMPYTSIAAVLKQVIGIDVTVDMVKAFLAQPTDVLAGTIEKATGRTVSEIPQQLDFDTTSNPNGVIIDFNIDHYSAPNPRLTVGRATTRMKTNGAVVRTLRLAKKGKSYNSKSMFSPAAGTSVTKVSSTTTKICKTSGTTVKMLKPGVCKLKVTTSKSRKSASATVTVKVS